MASTKLELPEARLLFFRVCRGLLMNGHDLKLGELLPNTWHPRDAIHVAVIPVEAGEDLHPGEHVGLTAANKAMSMSDRAIGVVDPFLSPGRSVARGECFWLLLYPGSITSLKHEWSHPSFPSGAAATAEEKAESEAWLSDFIGTWPNNGSHECVPMYKEEIASILRGDGGTIYGREGAEVPPEFWVHLERLTGRQISASLRDSTYFDCRC